MALHPWYSSYSPVGFYGLVQGGDSKMLFHYMDGNAIEITNKEHASFLGSCCPFAVCSMLYRAWDSPPLVLPMLLCVCGMGSLMWNLYCPSSIIASSGWGYSFKLSGRLVLGVTRCDQALAAVYHILRAAREEHAHLPANINNRSWSHSAYWSPHAWSTNLHSSMIRFFALSPASLLPPATSDSLMFLICFVTACFVLFSSCVISGIVNKKNLGMNLTFTTKK